MKWTHTAHQALPDWTGTRLLFGIVVLLLAAYSHEVYAQKARAPKPFELDAAVKSRYDSLVYLADTYKGSPLVFGYRKVVCVDTAVGTPDSIQAEAEPTPGMDLLDARSGKVLVSQFQYTYCYESSDKKRVALWISYSMCSYAGDARINQVILDVHDPSVRDSGDVYQLEDGLLRLTQRGTANYGDNYYIVGKGTVLQWDDPMRQKINTVWLYKDKPIFVVLEGPAILRLYDENKRLFSDWTFSAVSHNKEPGSAQRAWVRPIGQHSFDSYVDLETGEIETSKTVQVKYMQWWYCNNRSTDCIDKVKLSSIENFHPTRKYSGGIVKLELTEKYSKRVVYRKRHNAYFNLGPEEIGGSSEINLDSPVWTNEPIEMSAEFVELW